MKCKYCKKPITLADYGHGCEMGDCRCGAHVERVEVDDQEQSYSTTWWPPKKKPAEDDYGD